MRLYFTDKRDSALLQGKRSPKLQAGYKRLCILLLLFFIATIPSSAVAEAFPEKIENQEGRLEIKSQGLIIRDAPFTLTIRAVDPQGRLLHNCQGEVLINIQKGRLMRLVNNRMIPLGRVEGFHEGEIVLKDLIIEDAQGINMIHAYTESFNGDLAFRMIPGWLTLIPPLLAILLALTLKQVIISLFIGILAGAVIIYGYSPFLGILRTLDTVLIDSVARPGHVSILTFDILLAAMVMLIARCGGSGGMVNAVRKWAKTPRSGQVVTWIMGLLIFFDDYANSLIVGTSMRPLTDRLKISREKLSFIVDSTAAPVANLAVISTWIGFEIGVIADGFKSIGLQREPYMMFLYTIPYRFYPLLMLAFVFLIGYMGRDFGPMLTAEIRARKKGKVLAENARPLMNIDEGLTDATNAPERWFNGVIPILVVILVTIWGLWYSGTQKIMETGGYMAFSGATPVDILNNANSFRALLWASFAGNLTVILMILSQKIMNIEEIMSHWIEGAKSIMPALLVLILAWSIGSVCRELNTGAYVAALARGNILPQLLPLVIFLISGVISFATGTSWGTMSIVMPIAIYVGFYLPPDTMAPHLKNAILLGSISGVLAGATFGDHCSPISDTTIMSSMASGADHMDHVRTQMPYAVTVAGVSMLAGTIPAGFGLNPWVSMLISLGVLYGVVRFFGKDPNEADTDKPTASPGEDVEHTENRAEGDSAGSQKTTGTGSEVTT